MDPLSPTAHLVLRKEWPDIITGVPNQIGLSQIFNFPVSELHFGHFIERCVIQLFVHEINECLRHDGIPLTNPHPEIS